MPYPRRLGPDRLSVGAVLLAVAALALSEWGLRQILLPGLNTRLIDEWQGALARAGGPSMSSIQDLSLGALGIRPYLFAAWILLILSVLVRQVGGSIIREATTPRAERALLVLTLCIAIVQGAFVAAWLERAPMTTLGGMSAWVVTRTGLSFRVPAVLAMATSTLLLVVLARMVTALTQVNGVACLLAIEVAQDLVRDVRTSVYEESVPQLALLVAVAAGLSLALLGAVRSIALEDGRARGHAGNSGLRITLHSAGGVPLALGAWLLLLLGRAPSWGLWSFSLASLPSLIILVLLCVGLTLAWPVLFRVAERASEGIRAAGLFVRGVCPGIQTEAWMHSAWKRPTVWAAGALALIALVPTLLHQGSAASYGQWSSAKGALAMLTLLAVAGDLYAVLTRRGQVTGAPSEVALTPAPTPPQAASGRCPACAAEVVDDFVVCWSCGGPVSLIAAQSPRTELPDAPAGGGTPTTVARMAFPFDTEVARLRLEAEGIPVRVLDTGVVTANWFLTLAVGGIRIQVPSECAEQARTLLFPATEKST